MVIRGGWARPRLDVKKAPEENPGARCGTRDSEKGLRVFRSAAPSLMWGLNTIFKGTAFDLIRSDAVLSVQNLRPVRPRVFDELDRVRLPKGKNRPVVQQKQLPVNDDP